MSVRVRPARSAEESWTAELSVVIVNYNTGLYLERCLRSLETHRGALETDVLVIDNASRDGSHKRAVEAHPEVRLIENPTNRFLAPAWNQGIRDTLAPFVLLLNPDTQWWSGTLADYVRVTVEHPQAGIVGPMVRSADGAVYPSGRPFPSVLDAAGHAFIGPITPHNRFTRRYHMNGWDRSSERVVDWVSGSCMLIRREALDEVGLFDERFPLYGEELDMATRMKAAGWLVLFTPEVEILHEEGISTRQLGHRSLVLHSQSVFRYFRKHRASGWRRVLVPVAWVFLRLRAEVAWAVGRVKGR